jgi:hypothetical protein
MRCRAYSRLSKRTGPLGPAPARKNPKAFPSPFTDRRVFADRALIIPVSYG